MSQIHTPLDWPVRAADFKTRLPDGLNGAEAKREGGIPHGHCIYESPA
jgi:hypothetical protein